MYVMGLTPCHGQMSPLFVDALFNARNAIDHWRVRDGALVGVVRDKLARDFLDNGLADIALWIDADQWFSFGTLTSIIAALEIHDDIDIIGAPYAKREIRAFVDGRAIGPPVYEPLALGARRGPLREVQHTGLGFMAVRRRVYERIADDVRTVRYDTGDGKLIAFHHYPINEPWPEDVSFLRNAARAGFKTWLHTEAPVGHITGNVIVWPPVERGAVTW